MTIQNLYTKQFFLTVAAGKRLIAKGVLSLEQLKRALEQNTVVIVAGTTSAYIAEELLLQLGQAGNFEKNTFFRGVNTPPGISLQKGEYFNQDIIIEKGIWLKDKTIFDVAQQMGRGDVILKGANALDPSGKQAGVLIGNPSLGTSGPILQAVIGRRAELIIPVGLEKRVEGSITDIAAKLNQSDGEGLRMLLLNGIIVTELVAIKLVSDATAKLIAAGGVGGAEGGCWIEVTGTSEQMDVAVKLIGSVAHETPFGG